LRRRKVVEGVGNHALGFEEDFIKTDSDLLSIEDLIPEELKDKSDSGIACAEFGKKCHKVGMPDEGKCCYRDEGGMCRPIRFRFRIVAEFERHEESH